MKETARSYYADLVREYPSKIRQLVPKYDEMVRCIIELLQLIRPERLLDVGAGIGNVADLALQKIRGCTVTAIEASEEMVVEARRLLSAYGARATVIHQDFMDFTSDAPYDAVISNLVIHNLPLQIKRESLLKLHALLKPGGAFVWGDLVRHPDGVVQEHYVAYRKAFARAAGCPLELIERNFHKEENQDHPLTAGETLEEARAVGFEPVSCVWAHDTFALFLLRKQPVL
ncbi:MAG: class I SAM-dependent methyltransferase [Gemmatimonadota bacterium]|nr:MAG: class I SAM-dependent methyltransferase [Gemmatimonadota bacterium]